MEVTRDEVDIAPAAAVEEADIPAAAEAEAGTEVRDGGPSGV